MQHLIQLIKEQRGNKGRRPSGLDGGAELDANSQVVVAGAARLDAGEAVAARGRRCRGQCGRASGGGTMYVGYRRKASAAAVAELSAAPVLPRVGLGFVGWDVWRCGEPCTASRGPHPLYSIVRRGPTNH
jgi:hypothetical protein